MQERIGKLLGGSAILWIGDPSPIAAQARKELAERTAEAMRGAMRNGVLPGGGIALLSCKKIMLEKYHTSQETDERAAFHILAEAVEAPIKVLLQNAGGNPFELLAQIAVAGQGYGYDVIKRPYGASRHCGLCRSNP
jgi:chaperonin GroEL